MKQILAILILCLSFVPYAKAAESIGKISIEQGIAREISFGHDTALKTGDDIFLNNHIKTDEKTVAKIVFNDETSITLGPESNLIIDEYIYHGEDAKENKLEVSLPKSAFHYITGKVKNKDNSNVKLNLDFGSIGIRGTQVWRDMVSFPQGDIMAMKCRIYIEDGQVLVTNNAGSVGLKTGEGTSMTSLGIKPTAARAWTPDEIREIKSKTLKRWYPDQ